MGGSSSKSAAKKQLAKELAAQSTTKSEEVLAKARRDLANLQNEKEPTEKSQSEGHAQTKATTFRDSDGHRFGTPTTT